MRLSEPQVTKRAMASADGSQQVPGGSEVAVQQYAGSQQEAGSQEEAGTQQEESLLNRLMSKSMNFGKIMIKTRNLLQLAL